MNKINRIKELADCFWSYIRYTSIKIIIFMRFLPVCKCPACEGEGGCMAGYYEPEWDECRFCTYDIYARKGLAKWFDDKASDLEWAGKISPLKLLMWKILINPNCSLIINIKCVFGFHTNYHSEDGVGEWCLCCGKDGFKQ